MHVRSHDGLTLHAQVLGSGPPVVMLHGLVAGNLATWYFGVAPVLARRYRVILFDFRGHGASERAATGYGIEPSMRDLESVIDQCADEPVSLVGHSYGGCVALKLALEKPERVRELALVEAPLPPARAEEIEEFVSGSPERMVSDLPTQLRSAVLDGGRRGRRFLEAVRYLVRESSLVEELGRCEDIPDGELASLRVPLLAIYGRHSRCRPVGERLARVLPSATHLELDGGHNLPFDNAPEVAAALDAFLLQRLAPVRSEA